MFVLNLPNREFSEIVPMQKREIAILGWADLILTSLTDSKREHNQNGIGIEKSTNLGRKLAQVGFIEFCSIYI